MKQFVDRAIPVAEWAVGGFLLVFVVAISVVVFGSAIALMFGASALDLGVGPVPLMSFRNSAAGYSFQSEWGVGALAYLGAIAGACIAIRRPVLHRSR